MGRLAQFIVSEITMLRDLAENIDEVLQEAMLERLWENASSLAQLLDELDAALRTPKPDQV